MLEQPIIKKWILSPLFNDDGLTEVIIEDAHGKFRVAMIHVDLIFGERQDWSSKIWKKLKAGYDVEVKVFISEYPRRSS